MKCLRSGSFVGFALAVPALGCVGMLQNMTNGGGGGGHLPPGQGGAYTGAECAKYQREDARSSGVFQTYTDDAERRAIFRGTRSPGMAPADGALFVTCMDQTGDGTIDASKAIIADHLDFDDRHFDHLRAAVMVVDCADDPECSKERERDILGMMGGYAKRIDPAAADAAFGAAGAAKPLREAFAAKLAWSRATVEQRIAELDPRRRELWAEVPEQVWTERAEYYKQWSALYALLDPLLAAATTDAEPAALAETAARIRAVRGKYLDGCKVQGCLFTPLVLETTRALALLAVRRRDASEALAESALLDDDRLLTQDFSRAMLSALVPAAQREAERWEKYSRAQGDGADAATLEAMFGKVPPIQITADGPAITWGTRGQPNITAAMDRSAVETAGGEVKSTRRNGDHTVVVFADIVNKWDEEDCHDTNKIERIDSDGRIVYAQSCRKVGTHTERTKVSPIEVPVDEAAKLRAGDYVSAWVDKESRRGSVIEVTQKTDVVQVRGHRLKVKEPRPRQRW